MVEVPGHHPADSVIAKLIIFFQKIRESVSDLAHLLGVVAVPGGDIERKFSVHGRMVFMILAGLPATTVMGRTSREETISPRRSLTNISYVWFIALRCYRFHTAKLHCREQNDFAGRLNLLCREARWVAKLIVGATPYEPFLRGEVVHIVMLKQPMHRGKRNSRQCRQPEAPGGVIFLNRRIER